MIISEFFTEYDEEVASDLNVDPLGLQVIWSVYGQKIFKNRVSSISNDVRNYTINLFHHSIIKSLVESDSVHLSRRLLNACGEKKDSLAFKHACLVFFENLFVYSVIQIGDELKAEASGVLGISKARRKWNEESNNPKLIFSNESISHLLVRQPLLGVSGRYKTPMIEMKFFDKNYTYTAPKLTGDWNGVSKFINSTPVLNTLKSELEKYILEILNINQKTPTIEFKSVPDSLKQAYVKAFASPKIVGSYSRDFWLKNSGLDKGAAGAFLEVLDEQLSSSSNERYSPRMLFEKSKQRVSVEHELIKITNIEKIEPFLADIDLMFSLILSQKTQSKNDVISKWKTYKRDSQTLKIKAESIYLDKPLMNILSGSGRERLDKLVKLRNLDTVEAQLDHLSQYHEDIMAKRNQSPWLVSNNDGLLKILVNQRKQPEIDDKPNNCWVNKYYVPQFYNLVSGFQGVEQ